MKKSTILFVLFLLIFPCLSSCRRRAEIIGPVGFPNYRVKNLSQRLSQENSHPNLSPTKYAVLVNGNGENRFTADMTISYQILLENGFRPENIYILDYSATETYWHPVDDILTKPNLRQLLKYLKDKITTKDLLFVYVTDHGEKTKSFDINSFKFEDLSTIDLVNEEINQKEFAYLFKDLKSYASIFVFCQCYSGGFAEEVGKDRNIAVASSLADKAGWADTGDSFCGFFMLAFRDLPNSDTNMDGTVSISEAVEYAKKRNSFSRNKLQTPFIQSNLDPKTISLNLPTF